MTDREMELEDLITQRNADVLRFQGYADASAGQERERWRLEARRAARAVAWMVSLRSPETVLAMEKALGLA